jgi:hypothetical protein
MAKPLRLRRRAAIDQKPPRSCFLHGVQRLSEARRRLIQSYTPTAQTARGGLVFWQFWQWVPGARFNFSCGLRAAGPVVGVWHPCP